ncbi:unnamed protein product [Spirodela intermedia]|uniref:Uncharacterized protein n=1 Tax=Spirodela intermedia TaxID=51605 RepID=A0A7I8IQI2_SPIIN|nr:unnamed protein product [Spirodela intermedia]CAA6659794.1 unnamed protein product [Spirodela intermedia]
MSKFEDEAMELIETVAENSHHNSAKPFGSGATPKGGLIDAKAVETGMLLEKIDKMAEVQNLLLDRHVHVDEEEVGCLLAISSLRSEYVLTDGSVKKPHSIVEDVIVRIKGFYFPIDFLVVDMKITKELSQAPIILGRPFLATAKVVTDWEKEK